MTRRSIPILLKGFKAADLWIAPGIRESLNAGTERDDRKVFKSLKEECVWQNRLESLSQAQSVIGSWIRNYNLVYLSLICLTRS